MTTIAAPDSAGEAAARVLVVEDNAAVRAMLGAWLHLQGCESELQPDAAGGERALQERIFDLLICDVQLPDRDGPELAASITGPMTVPGLAGSPTGKAAAAATKRSTKWS